jgi:hypothetical protein
MQFQKGNKARPETRNFPVVTVRNNVQKRLIWDYRHIHSWSGVGAVYGVSGALAFQVAMNGYEPKNPILRQKLGFPIFTKVELITNRPTPASHAKSN